MEVKETIVLFFLDSADGSLAVLDLEGMRLGEDELMVETGCPRS